MVRPILAVPLGVRRCSVSDVRVPTDPPYATVVTFNPHPREFFTGQSRKLLTPLAEKSQQLEQLGVEQLVLLPFDREMAALSPQAFVQEILVEQLRVERISVGKDFRFGHQRRGTSADLQAIAAQYGVEVAIAPLQTSEDGRISSSRIRQALQEGEIAIANQLLGRPYTLTGTVVTGQKLGRTIGFPTANLQLPDNKFLPRYGVYSVRAILGDFRTGTLCERAEFPAALNLGCRPTVSGSAEPTAEVHILDWCGDLYGQTLTVSLETFLRPEQKFSSLAALKAQIAEDCQATRALLNEKF